jgi:hypothetical protein
MGLRAWKRKRYVRLTAVAVAALGFAAAAVAAFIPVANGNIDPSIIQIDPSANLFNNSGDSTAALNAPADADWVKSLACTQGVDCSNDCITDEGTGNCYVPSVTDASGGTGTWNGVRIIDKVDGADQNIFVKGGKENDLSTWTIAPGTVGSSKYDITQAYIANNQSTLFFGMERRGNNGTTAFDFEFNQFAPGTVNAMVNCSAFPNFPCRAVGDVLFTFEMSGSGGSGSAVPHYFTWNGTLYAESVDAQGNPLFPGGVFASINNNTTPPGPWGYVNSNGDWVLSPDMPRFEFAEVAVGLSGTTLPGAGGCGGSAFVQIRTRSSATANSDLKDATRIFQYQFGSLTATASKTGAASDGSSATLSGSAQLSGNNTTANLQWQVFKASNANCSGDPADDDCWSSISGATTSPFNYSAFATDDTAPATSQTFSIGSDGYRGEIFTVLIRLHVSKTVGASTCTANSSALTVKKVIAVDP